jgi:hypothetical protein
MEVSMDLYDGLGRQVSQVAPRMIDAGTANLQVDARSLVSGTYTCVVRAGGSSRAIPLVVRK